MSDTGIGVAVATSKSGTALFASAQQYPLEVAIVGKGSYGGVGNNGTGLHPEAGIDTRPFYEKNAPSCGKTLAEFVATIRSVFWREQPNPRRTIPQIDS